MRVTNPYRPGFNQPPAELAGRSDITSSIEEAFQAAAHDVRTPRPILLVGGRGVGKRRLLEDDLPGPAAVLQRAVTQQSPLVTVPAGPERG